MAFAPPAVTDRGTSPGFASNLASNNPFRRGTSPNEPIVQRGNMISASPIQPPNASTNPFLDDFEPENRMLAPQRSLSPTKILQPVAQRPMQEPPAELLAGMTLSEKSDSRRNMDHRMGSPTGPMGPPRHRTTRSQEGAAPPAPFMGMPRPRPRGTDPTSSSRRRENGRPRRNSDTSIMESDEDRKRRERRRREREARSKPKDTEDSKDSKSREKSGKPRKPNPRVDLIDKLDVTGLYGGGFHHDGPFDACMPQRNRKGNKAAPMQAFPEGSANNTIGGSGPVNKGIDYDKFHGLGAEGFSDYNTTKVDPYDAQRRVMLQRQIIVNPREVSEQVHGEESIGLGTSTFLEGAPASRVAIQRRESESEVSKDGGLQRKKSIAQRIKGISRPRGGSAGPDRIVSPEARYAPANGGYTLTDAPYASPGPQTPTEHGKVEVNPFFSDADKNASTARAVTLVDGDAAVVGRARAPSSPNGGILRRTTTEMSENTEQRTGLLSRVKSLKGPKRVKPERRATDTQE